MEVLARFANEDEILQENEYQEADSELGKVYLPVRGMKYAETVKFGLIKFLWMSKITVSGVSL